MIQCFATTSLFPGSGRTYTAQHGKKWWTRDISASTWRELLAKVDTPLGLYYSVDVYKDKKWDGAELIFDIDIKDLGLEHAEKHRIGKAVFPCEQCMDAALHEAHALCDVLRDWFGHTGTIYWSGNAGFHIHYMVDTLSYVARKSLVHYIRNLGLHIDGQVTYGKNRVFRLPYSMGKGGMVKHCIGDNFDIYNTFFTRNEHVSILSKINHDNMMGYKIVRDKIQKNTGLSGTIHYIVGVWNNCLTNRITCRSLRHFTA